MTDINLEETRRFSRMRALFLLASPLTSLLAHSNFAHQQSPQTNLGATASAPAGHAAKGLEKDALVMPVSPILPVRLNTTISSSKNEPGMDITGRIMQDVPLSPGLKIPAGSKVLGRIVEVSSASAVQGARVKLHFDKLIASHQRVSVSTNLRAIAGSMSVLEAQTPPIGPSESDVYDWLTTVQIGGDVVYGKGGPVTAANDPDEIVGREVGGGVLAKVTEKQGSNCRGAVNGYDQPQALWVFSHDACGTYGLEHDTLPSLVEDAGNPWASLCSLRTKAL